MKKGKYPDGVQIFTFLLGTDLFDVEDFKRNLRGGNLIRKYVWEFDVAVFMVSGISLWKSFCVVNT